MGLAKGVRVACTGVRCSFFIFHSLRVHLSAKTLAKYAPRLRGFTCYPDGARGGQPLTSVPYSEAKHMLGVEFEEAVSTHDICDISGKGGSCGV